MIDKRTIEEIWKDVPGFEGLYQISNKEQYWKDRNNNKKISQKNIIANQLTKRGRLPL
jgi:hypothetical protein